jgi:membrane protein
MATVNFKSIGSFFKDTFSQWSEDHASRLAAALAYYALFSVAPLLIIVIVVVGQVFGQGAVKAQILAQIQSSVGQGAAGLVQTMIEGAARPGSGIVATVISVVTILLGAMGVFGQLHEALNTVWGAAPRADRGVIGMVKDRFLAFLMVLGIGILFLLLLLLSTALSVVQKYLGDRLPGSHVLWQGFNFLIPFVVSTLLFALIYKVLPDAVIAWRDVWVGALATAVLMSIGNLAIGFYLGRSSTASAYGAAGSLVVLLLWIYYSAQIFFFGAELTQVYASRYGSRIRSAGEAVGAGKEIRAGVGARAVVQGRTGVGVPAGGVEEMPGARGNWLATLIVAVVTAGAIVVGIIRGSRPG